MTSAPRRSVRFLAAFALAAAVAAGGPLVARARADVVHLKEGGSLEGKVVAEDETTLTLDTRFGRQAIAKSRIERVEKKATAEEELAAREAKLAPGTPDEWFALAEFAGKKGLKKDRDRLLDKVLALDPDHMGANVARGRVKHDGKWMTPAERDAKVRQADDDAMRAKGLVPYDGRWVTPDEKEHLEKGDVLFQGKWMRPDAAKSAQGLVKLGNEWIPGAEAVARSRVKEYGEANRLELAVDSGDHVVAATAFGPAEAKELREAGERAFVYTAETVGEGTDVRWLGGQKVLALVLKTRDDFDHFARFFAAHEPKVSARWADGVARADGFYWWDPTGTSATYRGPRSADETASKTIHQLGHVLLNRHDYNWKFLPTWLDEGYAALTEYVVLGRNGTNCVSTEQYGTVRKGDLLQHDWFDEAVKMIAAGKDPPLNQILKRDLTTITRDEVKKSMVVVKWLRDEKRPEFLKLFAALRKQWPKGPASGVMQDAITAHAAAFAAFGMPPEQVDLEVRKACSQPGFGGRKKQ